jgi:nitroimidazol reductase NimA-like FMN-containing flavoprotein (pyridoxamine 5'-phosphate oxidase superfamily)
MHYAYDGESLYLLTTEGTKTRFIADNPEVCLQVEEVESERQWRSVMAFGRAEPITQPEAMEQAMQIIAAGHPSLQPALGQTQIDSWGRSSRVALYRIRPHTIDGRKTVS